MNVLFPQKHTETNIAMRLSSSGAEPKQLKKFYSVTVKVTHFPFKVSLLSGNVVKRRLLTSLIRNYRNDLQVLHISETSATTWAAPSAEKWRGR